MSKKNPHKITVQYLSKNISIVIGLVLVWRGIWYVLDKFDTWMFGGSHTWTALGGILIGLCILYLPDRDLKKCNPFPFMKTIFIKLYGIALPIFLLIDVLWLGLVAKNFYRTQIGSLMKSDVNWVAAIVFYLIFIAGLVAFVIAPAVEKGSWTHALLYGALFGLVCYATYDLTNLAVAKDWPLLVTMVDLVWGAALAASVSTVTYLIAHKIGI